MRAVTVIINGKIITPIRVIDNAVIVVEDGHIKDFGPRSAVSIPEEAKLIDVKGAYVSPGFIDTHLHGSFGCDVMDASEEDLTLMAAELVKRGVTSFIPTTLAAPLEEISRAVECIGRTMKNDINGAKILGVHLEGPYMNVEQKGALNPLYIILPKPEDYLPMLDKYPFIIRVSAAPEIPGGLELGQELKKRGIVASIAHSNATYQEVLTAVESGYSHATHIFSAMSTVRRIDAYRVSGVLESVLLLDELTTEIIADGHHLPPSLMRLVLKTKGIDKVCAVTDAMTAAGMGPGQCELGGLNVLIESAIPEVFEIPTQERNFVAKLADRSAFAGSVATMDQLVRNMVRFVGVSMQDAVKLVTLNPARIQGIEQERGLIAKGMKADLTAFDEEVNIKLTMVEGKVLYKTL